jgi:predicted nucleic acid-binding Zn ribbon protein
VALPDEGGGRSGLHPSSAGATIFLAMALRASHARAESAPPLDDGHAVRRAVVRHRRRRIARIEHRRERRWARRRFWILIGTLILVGVFLSVTVWEQLQSMFGI